MNADVRRRIAREGCRHVVDITPSLVVVDHAAHRQRVADERQIDDCRDGGIGVTARGHAVTSGNAALRHVELRLVRDIADHAGLSSRTEQSSLRALEDFDALEVRCVHIQVATGQLTRLLVQIDGNVWKPVDRAAGLSCHVSGAETPHEDLVLARPRGRCGHIGQVPDQIVQARDVQLLQGLAGERLDRDRHVLDVLGAPLRSDDNFLDTGRRGTGLSRDRRVCGSGVGRCTRVRPQDCRNCMRTLVVHLHWRSLPLFDYPQRSLPRRRSRDVIISR